MTRLAVGFTQQIHLSWLEWAAQLAVSGVSPAAARETLQWRLRPLVSVGGDDTHSNRGKVVSILLKTWVTVPDELRAFHQDALLLFAQTPPAQRLGLHWGMAIAVYPFLGVAVGAAGRLLALQGQVTYAQINRRVRETYGQRTSIDRATERIVYSLGQWGVLWRAEHPGLYRGAPPLAISQPGLSVWLVEAAMITQGLGTLPLAGARRQAVLFPFALDAGGLEGGPRLQVVRQGLDRDLLTRPR